MWKEFKEFAFRGNVLELAVAVILGLAFGAVITSLVNDVLMNLIAAAIGQPDFSQLTFTVNEAVIRYGAFLNALVNFLLVALALFLVVKAVNRATRKPADEEPTVRECPFCLSTIPARASRCSACTTQIQPVAS
jgi:large conductance mechanosensitive channel